MQILTICFFLAASLISCAQTTDNMELTNDVKVIIDGIFKDFNSTTPGYAIGISINGMTAYVNAYGAANLDYEVFLTPNSAFDIASVSKQFTAACIALLILENKLSLDAPVSDFVPELNKYADTIRIKHLIYNTSGLIDYHRLPRKNGRSWITFNYFDIDECISTSLSQDTLAFKPGDKWDYCNVNFMLLTKLIEKATGLSFSEFSKKNLFDPLGMNNTFINDDITNVIKNRVTPYNLKTKENIDGYAEYGIKLNSNGKYIQHPRTSPHYGGSGVVTTVYDLLKWSENMITKKMGGQQFYDLMHKTMKFNHDRDNQAFGLYLGAYRNRNIVAWDGGDWGISSQLIRFPEKGIAIIVLSNLGSGEAYRKANEIADILIDNKYL